jgi:cell division protein FtsN
MTSQPDAVTVAPAGRVVGLPPKRALSNAPYSGYWVQVGSYTDIKFAQDCWRKLYLSGCADAEIFSKELDGEMRFRVKVGPYQDKPTADFAREILRHVDPDYKDSFVVQQ